MPKKVEEEKKDEQIINTEAAKAKVEEVANNVKEGANNMVEKVKGDKKLLAVCCACCVVVVVLLLALILGCCNGPKKAVKSYAKGIVKMDEKKVCKSMHKNMIEEDYDDIDDCYDNFEELFDKMKDEEKNYKSYEITNKKVLDKDDVEEMAEDLEEKYDISEKSLKKVVRFSVNFDAKGSDNDQKVYIYVGKIKGHWYVIDQESR
jgi:hypothetical protein